MQQDPLAEALRCHEAGDLERAAALYRDVLADDPDQADALHLLGVLTHQKGEPAAALEMLKRAIALKPEAALFHGNLGNVLQEMGREEEAIPHYEKALALNPELAPVHYNLALALKRLNRPDAAIPHFDWFLARLPDHAEARIAYGGLLREMGQTEAAVAELERALALKPDSAEAHNLLGNALCDRNAPEKARRHFKKALLYEPRFPEAHCSLGEIAFLGGDTPRAIFHYEQALAMDPPFPEIPRIGLAQALQYLSSESYRPNIEHMLLECFASKDVGHQKLAPLAAEQIRYKYPHALGADAAMPAPSDALFADPLLLALLTKTINVDAAIERPLTRFRRQGFLAGDAPETMRPFLAALAEQGLNNAYAFLVTAEEAKAHAALKAEIESDLATQEAINDALGQKLLRFSLYAPLHALAGLDTWKDRPLSDWPDFLHRVVSRTLLDWLEEQEIKKSLPALTPIADETSRAVQAQYEENPYPRWFSADRQRRMVLPATIRNAASAAAPDEILIAGCGSGQQAILRALMHPHIPITAVDLSRASLAYGVRMARRLGVENIEFFQADLLKLDALKKDFPMIECGGVLHHLADPVAGWSVLNGLLRPGGRMFIGLYSETARKDIVEARKWIAELGLKPTPEDMRALRERLFFGAEDAALPTLDAFKRCNDLFDLNGCRDLLFHVQEHRFTLPEIETILERLGLCFAGFHLEDPAVRLAYGRQYPDDPEMTNLKNWDRFEAAAPTAFVNMYQFWCEKPAG